MQRKWPVWCALALAVAVCRPAAALTYPWAVAYATPDYVTSPDTGVWDRGGPIMTGTVHIRLLFYGTGGVPSTRQGLLEQFIVGLDGSPLASVLTSYVFGTGAAAHLSGRFHLDSSIVLPDHSLVGDSIDGGEFLALINEALAQRGELPADNTVYVVIGDGTTTASFNDHDFCEGGSFAGGWHNQIAGVTFAFIGADEACGNSNNMRSPNSDAIGDVMVSRMWHEIAEAVSDPDPTFAPAFRALDGEIGDLCEGKDFMHSTGWSLVGYAQPDWDYAVGSSGALANVHLGSHDYEVQPLWQNLVGGGGCVRRLVANRPSVSTDATRPYGDLDGNHTGDLLYRDFATQAVSEQLISGGPTVAAETEFGAVTVSWSLYGVADFNGDGHSDLLWRDQDNGTIAVWINGGSIHLIESSSDDWVIRGVGNFDNNNCADILFQNMRTNGTRIWFNNCSLTPFTSILAGTIATDLQPPSSQNSDTVGVGDFDGDGHADILWHTLSLTQGVDTHSYDWWQMNGRHGPSFRVDSSNFDMVLGLADVHGNGSAQIIAVRGQNIVSVDVPSGAATTIAGAPFNVWRYAGSSTVAISGGGARGCLFFQNRQNGEVDRWLLDKSTGAFSGSPQVLVPANLYHDAGDQLIAF